MSNIFKYDFSLDEVSVSVEQVLRGMGYLEKNAPEYLYPIVADYLDQVSERMKLSAGFRLFDSDLEIDSNKIIIGSTELSAKKIITRHLRGASSIAVFAASAGLEFDEWIKSFYNANDQLNGYIVDTIGSEIVESAGDKLETELYKIVAPLNCSNRLSPGYCNWSVADQHKLFSLLPDKFCGISLSESALMQPIKSISGIIGIGERIKRVDYQCNICNLENCNKRISDNRKK